MKKYEYKTEFFNAEEKGMLSFGVDMERLERKLNDMGRLGWALRDMIRTQGGLQHWVLIFEREVSG